MRPRTILVTVGLALSAAGALPQEHRPGAAGVVMEGAPGVSVNGRPVARQGDATSDGPIRGGSTNVFINGRPVATTGDAAGCGLIVGGAPGVYVNGRPIAALGDGTGCGR